MDDSVELAHTLSEVVPVQDMPHTGQRRQLLLAKLHVTVGEDLHRQVVPAKRSDDAAHPRVRMRINRPHGDAAKQAAVVGVVVVLDGAILAAGFAPALVGAQQLNLTPDDLGLQMRKRCFAVRQTQAQCLDVPA
ncbi:hypothetical protein [Variovorax sp. J22R115]|uniref:hypothetical protein n=1 Tax=Variovorax sp. J22R115 TaxID=3053509 RepID=UPI002576F48E|nr:hypothetical protein [Variovorax sp. J22R115]MDM0053772.1 hypothetical protein [Variovorax sp. J22R115]